MKVMVIQSNDIFDHLVNFSAPFFLLCTAYYVSHLEQIYIERIIRKSFSNATKDRVVVSPTARRPFLSFAGPLYLYFLTITNGKQ
jgi:hypothetical protein